MGKCTAKAKTTGNRCTRHASIGMPTCRMHGGKAATGALSPRYKHGKYTTSLQGPLLGKYETSIEETKEVMDMAQELHLLDSRLMELAEAVSKHDAGTTFEDVGLALVELRGMVEGDTADKHRILSAIDDISNQVATGWDREEQWTQILKTVEIRKKVVEAEVKRMAVTKTAIPVDKVKFFLNSFREAFRQSCLAHAESQLANTILTDASARCNRLVGTRF